MEKQISHMNQGEIKAYILDIQSKVQTELSKGKDIDDFLDQTSIFDDFEDIIPEAEFGIFVLTILNGYKSEVILDKLVEVIQQSVTERQNVGK
ncbi:MAG: hypothetical protein HN820_00060 [Candidatus Marinimicrobia bacterium]|jgi:hypothetical protein|nr:hypothetical protein [Candidatus Neomarinimicrobiota bacterium]MBT5955202.1 hypothetical protein [Candidatus Neomarinimicrobiota bacterium]MBT6870521.1 hypothetical protein [Candidatus Neomarinimicrobiota bacterium]MBT7376530.1 hypothetical protein [Candidatus Neomarinimicrobiota bacterium]|tara:strand:+ start:4898 stop:5176 length:279 start_codon:yes stop_codon:yes gene_type:complete